MQEGRHSVLGRLCDKGGLSNMASSGQYLSRFNLYIAYLVDSTSSAFENDIIYLVSRPLSACRLSSIGLFS